MSEIQAQIAVLKQTADPAVADAIARLIEEGEDHELNRINVLDFSRRTGLDEERMISGFLHASRLGLFDLIDGRRKVAPLERCEGPSDGGDGRPPRTDRPVKPDDDSGEN